MKCCFVEGQQSKGAEVQHESMSSLAGMMPGEGLTGGVAEADTQRARKLMLEVQDSPSLRQGKCFVLTPSGLQQSARPLKDGRTIIGTDAETCDIVLSPDDSELGKMHFVIEYSQAIENFLIKDLGDGNGTFMKIEGSHTLHDGDVLAFGLSYAGVQIQRQGPGSTLTLRFYEGPRASEMFSFGSNDDTIKIGRIEDCTVQIEDSALSRYQCFISYLPTTGWIATDGDGKRKSANGTW